MQQRKLTAGNQQLFQRTLIIKYQAFPTSRQHRGNKHGRQCLPSEQQKTGKRKTSGRKPDTGMGSILSKNRQTP
mgnify:CR=1 FL=1